MKKNKNKREKRRKCILKCLRERIIFCAILKVDHQHKKA